MTTSNPNPHEGDSPDPIEGLSMFRLAQAAMDAAEDSALLMRRLDLDAPAVKVARRRYYELRDQLLRRCADADGSWRP